MKFSKKVQSFSEKCNEVEEESDLERPHIYLKGQQQLSLLGLDLGPRESPVQPSTEFTSCCP